MSRGKEKQRWERVREEDRKESKRVHNGKAWVERRRTAPEAVGRRWGERVLTHKAGSKVKDKRQNKKSLQRKNK